MSNALLHILCATVLATLHLLDLILFDLKLLVSDLVVSIEFLMESNYAVFESWRL